MKVQPVDSSIANMQKTALGLLRQGCERPWEVAIEPFKVSPHAYYVGNSWVGGYLISTNEGLILIDTTMQPQQYLLFESIRKLGFDPRDIKLLLLSHAHYDHIGGARCVAEYTGAKVFMGKEDEYLMTERKDLIYSSGFPFTPFRIDEYFDDNKPIRLGEVTIHAIHTPGHTPGTRSFFLEDRDEAGNVYRIAMHGGLGLNTLTDDLLKESGWPVSLREAYLASLLRVRDMKVDIALTFHPSQTNMLSKVGKISDTANPFIDPGAWAKLMDEQIPAVKNLIQQSNK